MKSLTIFLVPIILFASAYASASIEFIGEPIQNFKPPQFFSFDMVYLGTEAGEKQYTASINPNNLQGFDRALFLTGGNYGPVSATGSHSFQSYVIAKKGNNLYLYHSGVLARVIKNYQSYPFEDMYLEEIQKVERHRAEGLRTGTAVGIGVGLVLGIFFGETHNLFDISINIKEYPKLLGFALIAGGFGGNIISRVDNERKYNINDSKKELKTVLGMIDYFLKNPEKKTMTVKTDLLRTKHSHFNEDFNRRFCSRVLK